MHYYSSEESRSLGRPVSDRLLVANVHCVQEAMNASAEFSTLLKAGCLMNPDLYGLGIDATIPACRSLIWTQFLKPRCGMNGSSGRFYMRKINFQESFGTNTGEVEKKGVFLQVLRSRYLRVLA